MLDPLYEAIGWLLALFYGLIPNLGVAIILLTCTVMLLLFPLTAKQARSMLAMQEVQPELKKLQAKYKGDRAKLVEEQQKLFQEHKVNPLGGCLPLLVQLPIFFALFHVLRNTYKYVPLDSDLFQALCPTTDTVGACSDVGARHLEFLSMDLSVTATNATGGFSTVLPYFLLVGLVTLVGYFQSKQTQRTQPKGGSNPQMMMIGRVLPIAFGVFSLWFPAGLVLYFLVSNLWRLGQQEVIFRKIHLPHRARQEAKKQGGDKSRPPDIDVTPRDAKPAKADPASAAVEATGAPEPEDAAPAPTPKPARGGGRLREMLGLPEPNGEPAPPARPAKPAQSAQTSGARKSTSGGSRSNQGRRRNKKRKR
jgi:YidC/Oxa1 family membrane protein insertase